ncbi:hypothetical protein EDD15DRAFT_2192982 [Pisolithus albus]|nr:hypothetical protein EDD15DRAFT_2192982 [Pisolithus albus]
MAVVGRCAESAGEDRAGDRGGGVRGTTGGMVSRDWNPLRKCPALLSTTRHGEQYYNAGILPESESLFIALAKCATVLATTDHQHHRKISGIFTYLSKSKWPLPGQKTDEPCSEHHEPGPQDPPSPHYKSFDSGPSFGNFGPLPDNRSCNGEPLWQKLWEQHNYGTPLTGARVPLPTSVASPLTAALISQQGAQCPLPVIPAPVPNRAMGHTAQLPTSPRSHRHAPSISPSDSPSQAPYKAHTRLEKELAQPPGSAAHDGEGAGLRHGPTSAVRSPYRRLIRCCPGAGNLTGSFTDEWWGHIGPNSLTTLIHCTLMSRRTAQQLAHLPDPIHPLSLSMLKSNTSSLKLSQLGCSKSDVLCAEYTRD